ncbi:MAG TPA: 5-formyltetrahydrofolate cyclo-ligase [Verrucomicrobiae bacterium]|nr:5-formyltetrahydrofolate cyclo-ligase [Verrucomicrobiae bacterium]
MGDTANSLAQRKSALRRELRQVRAALSPNQRKRAAQQAARHLARACTRWGARNVAVYLGIATELDTRPLIAALRHLHLYAPKLRPGNRLAFARLAPPLRRNRYGIAEPLASRPPARLDLIVLPLVGFDSSGARLGMGGGYYDRLLARPRAFRRPLRVGLAFAAQEIARVPVAADDVRLDAIVTELGLRRFR